MNGLYGRTIPEALTGGLTGGEHDQPRLILVEADGLEQFLQRAAAHGDLIDGRVSAYSVGLSAARLYRA